MPAFADHNIISGKSIFVNRDFTDFSEKTEI